MTEVIAKPFEDRPDYWEGRHMEVERTIRSMIELNCLGTNLVLSCFAMIVLCVKIMLTQ